MSGQVSRREMAVAGAAAALAGALPAARALGAGERVRVGVIGTGNRGSQLISALLKCPDAQVVALCDVYAPHLEAQAARVGDGAARFADYRRMVEAKDIDAVVVATPDHWHALQTIDACSAGKDVYVEKPLSLTIVEGRKMVEAARRHNRVVQVGLQRRSSGMYARLGETIRGGGIGKVTVARCYRLNNMWPAGIGKAPDGPPPPGLDWDTWLGPAARRAFNPNIAPYKFRWWKAYSSQVGNWGVHYFDVLRWMLGEKAPASVVSLGGRYAVDDTRDIPDTMEAVFEFASGMLLTFGQYEASSVPAMKRGEIEVRGAKGCLYAGSDGYEIVPESGGQFQTPGPRMDAQTGKCGDGDLDVAHMRNFIDCVMSRAMPNCDVEEGHRSTVFAHLANIALAARARVDWDADRERIVSPSRANGLLHYAYRKPWSLD